VLLRSFQILSLREKITKKAAIFKKNYKNQGKFSRNGTLFAREIITN
jgi:hypothetical protein